MYMPNCGAPLLKQKNRDWAIECDAQVRHGVLGGAGRYTVGNLEEAVLQAVLGQHF